MLLESLMDLLEAAGLKLPRFQEIATASSFGKKMGWSSASMTMRIASRRS